MVGLTVFMLLQLWEFLSDVGIQWGSESLSGKYINDNISTVVCTYDVYRE